MGCSCNIIPNICCVGNHLKHHVLWAFSRSQWGRSTPSYISFESTNRKDNCMLPSGKRLAAEPPNKHSCKTSRSQPVLWDLLIALNRAYSRVRKAEQNGQSCRGMYFASRRVGSPTPTWDRLTRLSGYKYWQRARGDGKIVGK